MSHLAAATGTILYSFKLNNVRVLPQYVTTGATRQTNLK